GQLKNETEEEYQYDVVRCDGEGIAEQDGLQHEAGDRHQQENHCLKEQRDQEAEFSSQLFVDESSQEQLFGERFIQECCNRVEQQRHHDGRLQIQGSIFNQSEYIGTEDSERDEDERNQYGCLHPSGTFGTAKFYLPYDLPVFTTYKEE